MNANFSTHSKPRHHAVSFLLDEKTAAAAVRISEGTRGVGEDPDFSLDLERARPHISLFHAMLDGAGAERCKDAMAAAVAGLKTSHPKGASGVLSGLTVKGAARKGGVLFWDAAKTPDLVAWHQAIVRAVEPLRKGPVPSPYPLTQRNRIMNRHEYGYPYVGNLFKPRITLRRLKEERFGIKAGPEYSEWPWSAESLILVEVDDFGVIQTSEPAFEIGLADA